MIILFRPECSFHFGSIYFILFIEKPQILSMCDKARTQDTNWQIDDRLNNSWCKNEN